MFHRIPRRLPLIAIFCCFFWDFLTIYPCKILPLSNAPFTTKFARTCRFSIGCKHSSCSGNALFSLLLYQVLYLLVAIYIRSFSLSFPERSGGLSCLHFVYTYWHPTFAPSCCNALVLTNKNIENNRRDLLRCVAE
jgi:hypothetical protein